jgi:asparagine synthetase B (glutamine-hydrolysing)
MMISRKAFVERLSKWDADMFNEDNLSTAYDKLSTAEDRKYIVAVVDNLNPNLTVYQATETEVKDRLTEVIERYRTVPASYIPRVYILGLYTGEEYQDPTQWGKFLKN